MLTPYFQQSLFNNLPIACLLLKTDAPNFTILDANEALLKVLNSKNASELIGKSIFDAFSNNPNEKLFDGVQNLRASLLTVLSQKEKCSLSSQRYDIAINNTNAFETRYWQVENIPLLNEEGEVEYILHTTKDITETVLQAEREGILYSIIADENTIENDSLTINEIASFNLDLTTGQFEWSPEFYKMCGRDASVFIPTIDSIQKIIHPDDLNIVKAEYQKAIKLGNYYRISHRIIKPNGQIVEVLSTGVITKNIQNEPIKITGLFQNITGGKQAEIMLKQSVKELIASEARYKNIFDNNPSPMFLWDFQTLQIVDCNVEALLLYKYTKEQFLQLSIKDIRPKEDVELIEASTKSEEVYNQIHKKIWRHKKSDGELFYANVTGHLLQYKNRKCSLVLIEDITQQLLAHKAIEESEAKYRSFFENSLDGILITITDGDIIAANPAACKMFKMTEAEICSKGREGLIDMDDKNIKRLIKERQTRGKVLGEITMIRKDGTKFNAEISSSVFFDGDGKSKTSMIIRDITERKQNEVALIASEKRYKVLFENNPSPMFIWDFESLKIIDCNDEALLLYGYSKQELLALTIKDLSPKEDLHLIEHINASEEDYDKIGKKTWRHLTKDKSIKHVFIVGHLIDYKGKKSSLVCLNDVTDKVKAEIALKDNELKLRTAQQVAQIGYWDFDFKTDSLTWSDELYNVFGITKEIFHKNYQSFVEFVDPEYKELVMHTSKYTQQTGDTFTIDYKITTPSGEKRVIQEHGYGELDAAGNVIRLFGTAQNITDRKLAEEKIRESNQRYKYVTKATSDAIWDWDLINDRIYWGEGFESIFGYNVDAINSNSSFRLDHIHPADVKDVMTGLYHVINGSETQWSDTYRFKKADDTYAYVTNKGFVIRDSNGKAVRMVGAKRDITKEREEELRLQLLESVVTNTTDMVIITDANLQQDASGPHIVYVNEAYLKTSGYSLDEVIGKTPRILQGPKTDKRELYKLKMALQKQQPCTINVINYKKNGEEFWSSISISPIKNANDIITHWVAIKRDITKEREEKQRLQLLESVVTNTSDMVIITEADPIVGEGPKIVYVNDAFTNTTGYLKEEVIGKTPRLLQGLKTNKQELNKLKTSLKKWQSCNITVVNYKKNGDEFWNNMSVSPVTDTSGNFTHWIAIARDVTERVRHNADIIQATIKTQEEERYDIGGELHDNVCQILTSSKIAFKMVENALPDNKRPIFNDGIEALNLAFKEIRNLSHRLAPAFLDDTTLEQAFKNTLKLFNVDDHYIIDLQFDDAFRSYHASKEFQLNLYRILQEQLNNILKHAQASTISVQGNIENQKLILSISDNGIGFNTKKSTTGIGLSNMKRRAELFNGEVIIDSEIGSGSKLTVIVPLQDLN